MRDAPGRWSWRDAAALAAVTLVAGALRVVRLAEPATIVFDEIYYAQDACWYILRSPAVCGITGEVSRVHPPLGKWLIAAGIGIFGYTPLGWRLAAAIAGTITVALTYLLARRILRSTLGGLLASGFLAIDFLHFVHSRVAMLDVFVTLFGVATLLCALYDLDTRHDTGAGTLRRPWRLLAGAAGGAAIASKWPGALMLVAALLLTVAQEMAARRNVGRRRALVATIREEGPSLVVSFAVLPALIYLVAHLGVVRGNVLAWPWQAGSWWRSLAARHLLMVHHHAGFFGTHPYQSPPWSWLLLKRPIVYFFEAAGGQYREILALGNPLVWWASIAALAHVALKWLRTKSLTGPEGIILAGFMFAYVPWLVLGRHRTFVFLFYLLPAVPFLGAALAYTAEALVRSRRGILAVGSFCALSLILFIFYFPLLGAVPIDPHAWKSRVGRFGTCAGYEETTGPAPPSRPGPPPSGWCWR